MRSWSRWCGLGAIFGYLSPKLDKVSWTMTLKIPPRRALRGDIMKGTVYYMPRCTRKSPVVNLNPTSIQGGQGGKMLSSAQERREARRRQMQSDVLVHEVTFPAPSCVPSPRLVLIPIQRSLYPQFRLSQGPGSCSWEALEGAGCVGEFSLVALLLRRWVLVDGEGKRCIPNG